ncbi:uncharacterized protein LOC112520082 [Cynara cardunculus var. scolymus]|uniref:uncharacterized protein LOC112520082 n=1 Tax=Cynara cardunculus var. scolymus TaxID=59895 RepID=UPI000D62EFA9|nr:uncharacterized protein LOC112520082 [Cynara cardunculus var. scolymus]
MAYENFLDCLRVGSLRRLPLVTRVKIAVGIARGMVFLKKKQREILDNMYPGRLVSEGFKDYDGASTSERPSKPETDDIRIKMINEYGLDRCKIMLDEKDFTAKLSNFKVSEDFERYTHEDNNLIKGNYYLGHEPDPIELEDDVSGFTVVFMEVLIGTRIYGHKDLRKINDYFKREGKKSLRRIAKLCFEICNEVDSESRILTTLEEYEEHIKYSVLVHI